MLCGAVPCHGDGEPIKELFNDHMSCRDKIRKLEQALATAQAEHMDYEFLQLRLQEFETTHAQQQKVPLWIAFYASNCPTRL